MYLYLCTVPVTSVSNVQKEYSVYIFLQDVIICVKNMGIMQEEQQEQDKESIHF